MAGARVGVVLVVGAVFSEGLGNDLNLLFGGCLGELWMALGMLAGVLVVVVLHFGRFFDRCSCLGWSLDHVLMGTALGQGMSLEGALLRCFWGVSLRIVSLRVAWARCLMFRKRVWGLSDAFEFVFGAGLEDDVLMRCLRWCVGNVVWMCAWILRGCLWGTSSVASGDVCGNDFGESPACRSRFASSWTWNLLGRPSS